MTTQINKNECIFHDDSKKISLTLGLNGSTGFLNSKNCLNPSILEIRSNRAFYYESDKKNAILSEICDISFSNDIFKRLENLENKLNIAEKTKKVKKLSKKQLNLNERFIKNRKIYQMIKQGYNNPYIAMILNCNFKDIAYIKKKIATNQKKLSFQKGRKSKITKKHIDSLNNLLEISNNAKLSSKKLLKKWINLNNLPEKFIGERHFRNILHKKCEMSYKKIYNFKSKGELLCNKNKRRDFVMKIINHIENEKALIFLDETSFNLEGTKEWGWSKKGKRLFLEKNTKSNNYSLIAAMTIKRIMGFMIFRNSVDSNNFLAFYISLLNFIKNEIKKPLKDYVLILDNASTHKKYLNSYQIEKELIVVWSPPYTPQLNPIEMLWSQWKRIVYKKNNNNSEKQLVFNIANSLFDLEKINLKGIFNHTVKYYIKCLSFDEIR